MSDVSPIPEGFHTITPHLIVKPAAEAMDFYVKAFGAVECCRFMMPGSDLIAHGLMKIGDSFLMVTDEFPLEMSCPGVFSPASGNGTTVTIQLYVEDVDSVYRQALSVGCSSVMEPMDAFWGDRYGQVCDPYGHQWALATHIADINMEEINAAAAQEFSNAPSD